MRIEVILTAEIFRRFSNFDTLHRRQAWRSPAIFASILCVCAIICYIMHHVQGALLLGTVLLIVGLGMPLVYFLNLHLSVGDQIKSMGLKRNPMHVYTLTLTEDAKGIAVENGREKAAYEWKKAHHAYRNTLDTYLYITPRQGFILPHTCIDEPDELWALITKMMPRDRCTDLRK